MSVLLFLSEEIFFSIFWGEGRSIWDTFTYSLFVFPLRLTCTQNSIFFNTWNASLPFTLCLNNHSEEKSGTFIFQFAAFSFQMIEAWNKYSTEAI